MLEENYVYLKAIVEHQNLGRSADVVAYQRKLQENLVTLAGIADSQQHTEAPPQAPQGGL